MKKPFKPVEELVSLNEELHTEFEIQELEQRLETDPLMVSALIGAAQNYNGVVCSMFLPSGSHCEMKYGDLGEIGGGDGGGTGTGGDGGGTGTGGNGGGIVGPCWGVYLIP